VVVVATDLRELPARGVARTALQSLTSAALMLPGLLSSSAQAAEASVDNVSIQYNEYNEAKRDLINVPSSLDPLAIAVFHATTNLSFADRYHFSLSYSQDTWSGATPVSSAPLGAESNHPILQNTAAGVITSGASPLLNTQLKLDHAFNPLSRSANGSLVSDSRNVLILSSASPESRDEVDLSFGYDWDEATLTVNSGFSLEQDYESFYGSVSGSRDFNQKLTNVSFGAGYTVMDTAAILDPDVLPYITTSAYDDRIERHGDSEVLKDDRSDITLNLGLTQILSQDSLVNLGLGYTHSKGYMENPYKSVSVVFVDPASIPTDTDTPITGNVQALMEQRPDRREQVAFSGKYIRYIAPFDAALHLTYEFSTDNWGIDTHALTSEWIQPLPNNWTVTPRLRYYSQNTADFYTPYLLSQQAYKSFAVDGAGRQIWFDLNNSDSEFYRTSDGRYVTGAGAEIDPNAYDLLPRYRDFDAGLLPADFSSDHRLSGFGALSAGLTLNKVWGNGIEFEAGIEYYDRRSSRKLGGGGNSKFADFDFYMANAAIRVHLDRSRHSMENPMENPMAMSEHAGHTMGNMNAMSAMEHGSHAVPAGVMFGHTLPAKGRFMIGYRNEFSRQAGGLRNGTIRVSDSTIVAQACPGTDGCRFVPSYMNMKMHMLDIMYAPVDGLTLMLMPQFMDMDMNLRDLEGRPPSVLETHEHSGISGHTTGGLGDTVLAGLVSLYQGPVHRLHLGLGLSIPTGSVDEELRRTFRNDGGLIHFHMQLGSGTWDLLPSLTYSGMSQQWYWGAQLTGTTRQEDHNASGYRLGDVLQTSAWSGYRVNDWFSASVRGIFTDKDPIHGDFTKYNAKSGPMDFPQNQGGEYWDLAVGMAFTVPSGRFAGNSLNLEWQQPLRDDVNGFQRERDGTLAASWTISF
jgi:hypothetical protein